MKKALEPLILSWRVPELRARLLFVMGAIIVYVLALHIPIPNVDHAALQKLFTSSGGVLDFIDIFGGGALRKLSILALGIMPYITSSIVFQILTIAFPYFKELQNEGEYGRRKMAQWTRWAAIGLTLIQATVATKAFQSPAFGVIPPGSANFIQSVLSLAAGTMFLIWLGEQITTRGVGNGISFIIFAGIVARLPQNIFELIQTGSIIQLLLLLGLFVGTIYAVITVTQGERRIPVKYAPRQAGRRMVQGQRSYLPLKLAAAGVIPIIFAVSIVLFPGQIANWYLRAHEGENTTMISIAQHLQVWFSPTSLVASLLYAALVMGFTYFYTAVIFDVRDLSDNLKRAGGQIQGYAPGRPTEIFINRVLTRITFAGGLFLASLALMQWWAPQILGLQNSSAGGSLLVGGTSLLIVVGVALEIMQNLDQQLKMRQYEGFAKNTGKGRL
ncbi:protein translocase subunit secY/sec61 alpha [Abditibacterium utsteinense]|uniref:Protein translocase subunit SecY n=1 Tax=Abditibacterium utsteinense TaxID=1960156 RepID=A0A2S8ST22_9BACT|nr:preprotein translocase subunit SecY [Abditibacterium utsteinense]PQV63964.1 protein translocase subunit secY/sec61 alpha [Abditibacterium utsteinense]